MTQNQTKLKPRWLLVALSFLILLAAGWVRTYNLNWDVGTHLHPDERYLTMVAGALEFPERLGHYWDTSASPLNPENRGYGGYVYGTLPLFVTRVGGEWMDRACGETPAVLPSLVRALLLHTTEPCHPGLYTGYGGIHLVGRLLSTGADLLTLVGLALLARQLFGERVALLAAALYAFAVLPIQHAHFFVVDSFAAVFVVWTLVLSAYAVEKGHRWPLVLAGITAGLALGSKVSTWPATLLVGLGGVLVADGAEDGRRYRLRITLPTIVALSLSGALCLLTFRFVQPYAFAGPGFLDVGFNPSWMESMRFIRRLMSGEIDTPPGHQWANRAPVWFPWRNMVFWGMGLPLGLTAWLGWGALGWRMARRRAWRPLLPWLWGTFYFLYQSTQWVKSMRYLLPVYPVFALFAAWLLMRAHERSSSWRGGEARLLVRVGGWALASAPWLVLAGTVAWALAFLQIYVRPFTRVEASRWIYNHVPTALTVETEAGLDLPVPLQPNTVLLESGEGITTPFTMSSRGTVTGVTLNEVQGGGDATPRQLHVNLTSDPIGGNILSQGNAEMRFDEVQFSVVSVSFLRPVVLEAGEEVHLNLTLLEGAPLTMGDTVQLQLQEGSVLDVPLPREMALSGDGVSVSAPLSVSRNATVTGVSLPKASVSIPGSRTLAATLTSDPQGLQPLTEGDTEAFLQEGAGEQEVRVPLPPTLLEAGKTVYVQVRLLDGPPITLDTSVLGNEHWDDQLPVRLEGRDPFWNWYRGLASSPNDLMNLYDPDTPKKREQMLAWLDEVDYVVLSSNRLYGSIARLPLRYPLTTTYYQALFDGSLGFELAAEFVSYPSLGFCQFPDQEVPFEKPTARYTNRLPCSIPYPPAEEAFSVYDHPQVLIFAKTPAYSRARAEGILTRELAESAVPMTPLEATRGDAGAAESLVMDAETRAVQESGGTWSKLFRREALHNRHQAISVLVWWMAITLLGWMAFPWLVVAFPALRDRGYGLARAAGLLVWAYPAWLLASLHLVQHTRLLLWVIFALELVATIALVRARRALFLKLLRERWRTFLRIEVLFALLYLAWVLVRYANPDLYHPVAGGEKPMDFAYLNAVVRSSFFPPYDPWFAGGAMNYYYFGFVLVGSLIKALGIVPAVSYNLAIPSLFAMVGTGAFSLASNLVGGDDRQALRAGLWGTFLTLLLGNLGELHLLIKGLAEVGQVNFESLVPGYETLVSAARGLWRVTVGGAQLPFRPEWWYWNATRIIKPGPGEYAGPINEFPLFTFLYGDLHAHMMALPLTQVALGLALNWGLRRRRISPISFVLGALIAGALRATNTWDYPTYLALMSVGFLLPLFRSREAPPAEGPSQKGPFVTRGSFLYLRLLVPLGLFLGAEVLFRPYIANYVTAYGEFGMWGGRKTSLSEYLIMHGQFLVPLVLLALSQAVGLGRKVQEDADEGRGTLFSLVVVGVGALVLTLVLFSMGVVVAWIAVPLGTLAALLFLDATRAPRRQTLWFWVGTALALTLAVEVVQLKGDLGRMNTVFKFYVQVWVLLSLAAAVAFERLWHRLLFPERGPKTSPLARGVLGDVILGVLTVLVFATVLYPLFAVPAKMRDRWVPAAPRTLDGMAYMPYATFYEANASIPLAPEARVIRWMQEHVEGTPTIMEANAAVEYVSWGNRVSIYTGLPSVVGWRWHQVQQRMRMPDLTVESRQADVREFYSTPDPERAWEILQQYGVEYVVVTPYERTIMDERGRRKFEEMVERGWLQVAYRDDDSVVYRLG